MRIFSSLTVKINITISAKTSGFVGCGPCLNCQTVCFQLWETFSVVWLPGQSFVLGDWCLSDVLLKWRCLPYYETKQLTVQQSTSPEEILSFKPIMIVCPSSFSTIIHIVCHFYMHKNIHWNKVIQWKIL